MGYGRRRHGPWRMPIAVEIEAAYTESLSDLTFNSKPVINSLTMIAEELLPHAVAIVGAIERRVANVAPDQKLSVMYLIDSICKNVGGVYIDNFAQRLPATIGMAYATASPKMRTSLQKLVKTWSGVFPSAVVQQAVAIVNGAEPLPPTLVADGIPAAVAGSNKSVISKNPVHAMSEPKAGPVHEVPLDVGARKRARPDAAMATDAAAGSAVATIGGNSGILAAADGSFVGPLRAELVTLVTRITTHMNSGLPADLQLLGFAARAISIYSQIITHLVPASIDFRHYTAELQKTQRLHMHLQRTIEDASDEQCGVSSIEQCDFSSISPAPPPLNSPPLLPPPPPPGGPPVAASLLIPPPPVPPPPSSQAVRLRRPPLPPPPMPSAPASSTPPVDVSKLLASLAAAGVLQAGSGAHGPPEGGPGVRGGNGVGSRPPANAPPPPPAGLARVLWSLHEARPLQCKTCGVRFGTDGRDGLRQHMDSHFRRNMRAKAGGVAPPSRRWMLPSASWARWQFDESANANIKRTAVSVFDAIEGGAGRLSFEETSPAKVPVPIMRAPSEVSRLACFQCGEPIEIFFDEAASDWMLRDAVTACDGTERICHGACQQG